MKKVVKKLTVKTGVVSKLNLTAMNEIKGGTGFAYTDDCEPRKTTVDTRPVFSRPCYDF